MIFNTWVYGLFLVVTFCVYRLTPARWRSEVLICFGLYFYWYYYPIHVVLIAAMTLLVFTLGWVVRPGTRGRPGLWLAVGTTACLGTLAYFKYQGFALDCVSWILARFGSSV